MKPSANSEVEVISSTRFESTTTTAAPVDLNGSILFLQSVAFDGAIEGNRVEAASVVPAGTLVPGFVAALRTSA